MKSSLLLKIDFFHTLYPDYDFPFPNSSKISFTSHLIRINTVSVSPQKTYRHLKNNKKIKQIGIDKANKQTKGTKRPKEEAQDTHVDAKTQVLTHRNLHNTWKRTETQILTHRNPHSTLERMPFFIYSQSNVKT